MVVPGSRADISISICWTRDSWRHELSMGRSDTIWFEAPLLKNKWVPYNLVSSTICEQWLSIDVAAFCSLLGLGSQRFRSRQVAYGILLHPAARSNISFFLLARPFACLCWPDQSHASYVEGGGGIPLFENRKVSKFQRFKVSNFQSSKVSKFQNFKIVPNSIFQSI